MKDMSKRSFNLGTGFSITRAFRLFAGVGVVDRVGGSEGIGVEVLDLMGGLVIR
jgi:hypothetical protein